MKRKKTFLSVLCLSLWALSGNSQETLYESIMHDDLEREYILYVPDTYVEGNPLVMNYHGYTSNGFQQMFYGDFRGLADEFGFLLVHPEGTNDLTGTSHWNVGWGFSTVDDVGFASALIDSLYAEYSINLDRVYSTGMSNGGFFSFHLACNLSERVAAIASVTGTMLAGSFTNCNPEHPMPAMQIHGTGDPTVAYYGAFGTESASSVVNYWAEFNSATNPPLINQVPDIDMSDGCMAEHWLFEDGDNGSTVEHYKIFNGGHTWPGAEINVGTTNQDFDASDVIWEFFNKYDINGLIIVDDLSENSSASIDLSPNPSAGLLNIKGLTQGSPYSIFDQQGRLVLSGKLEMGEQIVDCSELANGLYILNLDDGQVMQFMIAK